MRSDSYRVNEIFLSLQGEGKRAGEASVFVRFSGCNLECAVEPGPKSPGGFDCDTEFASGVTCTLRDLIDRVLGIRAACRWVVLTGGEPGLQVNTSLIEALHSEAMMIQIETNGTIALPAGIDWVTVSPKIAEHAIRQTTATEVKYVRQVGQGIPKTRVKAEHYLISPAFDGLQPNPEAMRHAIRLCLEDPQWSLSIQQHKSWGMR